MADTVSHYRLKLWVMFSTAHAACTAILWIWTLGVSSLGFKDQSAWTAFDHVQAAVVPTLTLILTTPGRFVMSDGIAGLLLPWIANSVLWGGAITLIYVFRRRRTVS